MSPNIVYNLQIVEVKSPNDRLSNKQILWIEHLRGLGVDAVVCHVEAVGGKRIAAAPVSAVNDASKAATEENGKKRRHKRRRRQDSGDDFL